MMSRTHSALYRGAFFLALIALLGACKGTQYTPANLPERQLSFGNGGGFAAAYHEYLLLENGQLFVKKGITGEHIALPAVKKRLAKAWYKEASVLFSDSIAFNYPGNIYYFVQWKNADYENRITWGDPVHPDVEKMKALYDELMTTVLPADDKSK